MAKQLLLFHTAVSAYFSGNQAALEENMELFEGKVKIIYSLLSYFQHVCVLQMKSPAASWVEQ